MDDMSVLKINRGKPRLVITYRYKDEIRTILADGITISPLGVFETICNDGETEAFGTHQFISVGFTH